MPRLPPAPVIRIFFLGIIAVVAATYALVRYRTYKRPKMVVPVEVHAIPGEIPAPDIVPLPP